MTAGSQDWREFALCREVDSALMFPAEGESPRTAQRIRGGCTVARICLEEALSFPAAEDYGVWGGTTRRQRLKIRAARRSRPTPLPLPVPVVRVDERRAA